MKKLSVLFLTHQLPFPPNSGGTVKSWNFVNYLSKTHNLSVGTLLKDDDEKHESDFKNRLEIKNYISQKIDIGRSPINLAKSYIYSDCLNVFRNFSNLFQNKVDGIAKMHPIILVDHYEMFQYVPNDFKGKVIMHTHNAEFMLWQRMSELSLNPIKKLILKLEANRVKKYEKIIFKKSDLIFSTPSDIDLYQKHGFDVSKHRVTYHLGNDTLLKLADLEFDKTEKAITFIGTLSWEPNIDGICWFLDNCWESIKKEHPDCKVYILGKKADGRIVKSAKNDSQVIFTGFVKELDEYLQKTRVYIAPLRFGSGMKVKVLEGLYRGNPCVTTSVGAEGLELVNGDNIIIGDNPEAFINGCLTLLEDETTWNIFRDKTRKLAADKYTWKALFLRMEESMQEVK